MDETKLTSAPPSADRQRLAGRKQAVAKALIVVILLVGLCALVAFPPTLSGVIVFLASLSVMLFTFLGVTAVFSELFESQERPNSRRSEKEALLDLHPFFAGLSRVLRPVLRPFSSWHPLSLRRFGEAVLLPDSMAICGACLLSLAMTGIVIAAAWISLSVGQPVKSPWLYLPLLVPALLLTPFLLTAVLWVSGKDVRLVRFFVVIPYWVHRVPHDAELDLWGLEDGLAFKSRSRALYALQVGTPTSAPQLSRHIAAVLERAGWQDAPPGNLPRMSRTRTSGVG